MKKQISHLTRVVLVVGVPFIILTGIEILTEITGGRFGDYLQHHYGITKKALFISLLGLLFLSLIIEIYQRWKEENKKPETASEENIEINVLKLLNSLKDRYEKRYDNKLDERFEITLEVSEDSDSTNPQKFVESYLIDSKISEAFTAINNVFIKKGRLLIVGSPGGGKTVLLLKLALNLLDNFKDVKKDSLPVIFNLATWTEEYNDLNEWFVSLLNSGYGLSRNFAWTLLKQNRIIFLLDGMDELDHNETPKIAIEKRAKCLASLNDYLENGRKVVITSRLNEYDQVKLITGQKAPVSAKVKILNLTKEQILLALEHANIDSNIKHHASAKNLLKIFENDDSENLLAVLTTPFYFTTAMNVFDHQIFNDVKLPKSIDEIKTFLIKAFFERNIKKKPNPNCFEAANTKYWLNWLARLMQNNQLVTFELTDLESGDLINDENVAMIFGIFTGVIYAIVLGILGSIWSDPILKNDFFSCSFLGFFLGWLVGYFGSIRYLDKNNQPEFIVFRLDFQQLSSLIFWKKIFVIKYLFPIFSGCIAIAFASNPKVGLITGLIIYLTFVLYNLGKAVPITYIRSPYQRISGEISGIFLFSLINILGIICIPLLLSALVPRLFNINLRTIIISTSVLIILIIPISLIQTTTLLYHFFLRFCLWIEGSMPLKYATFLDYAADLRILEKDGGFWRFRHQNLQEYFANLKDE